MAKNKDNNKMQKKSFTQKNKTEFANDQLGENPAQGRMIKENERNKK